MIDIRFKDACERCAHVDPDYDINKMYSGDKVVSVYVTIRCRHDEVCKHYDGEKQGRCTERAPG